MAAALPTAAPEDAEPLDAVLADLDTHAGPRPDALAAPAVLRLLPGELLPRRRARRPAVQRHRRPGDALGDQPGGDRARAGRARPAAPGTRPPRRLRARRPGRRRHPGHRFHGDVHRGPRRTAPRDRGHGPRRRRTGRLVRDLRLDTGPLLAAQGRHDERSRRARRALDRRRPQDPGDGRRRAARGDGRRRGRRRPAGDGAVRGRYDVHGRGRPHGRDRRGRAASTAPGCTSTPRGPALPRSVPSTAGSTPASSTPTPT